MKVSACLIRKHWKSPSLRLKPSAKTTRQLELISHVGLLKERMNTQIFVEKLAGGVSEIRIVD
jgi:DNA repair exonuclease SbcCD ATPase subunit